MGWLLNIVKFAHRTKIKCMECGSESGVDFLSDETGLYLRCQNCGARSPFDPRDMEPPKLEDENPKLTDSQT